MEPTPTQPTPAPASDLRRLRDVHPGSAWRELDAVNTGPGFSIGCRWPAPVSGLDVGYIACPCHSHTTLFNLDEQVEVLAANLTAEQCAWILSTTGRDEQEQSERRARHIDAGGTIADFTEPA